jgi:hypothetical protein
MKNIKSNKEDLKNVSRQKSSFLTIIIAILGYFAFVYLQYGGITSLLKNFNIAHHIISLVFLIYIIVKIKAGIEENKDDILKTLETGYEKINLEELNELDAKILEEKNLDTLKQSSLEQSFLESQSASKSQTLSKSQLLSENQTLSKSQALSLGNEKTENKHFVKKTSIHSIPKSRRDLKSKYWFKAKSFGYGWTPCSREGWLITILFVLLLIALPFVFMEELNSGEVPVNYLVSFFGLIFLFVYIAYRKGEKPKWNFGNSNKINRRRK